jgi:hypothetical protein
MCIRISNGRRTGVQTPARACSRCKHTHMYIYTYTAAQLLQNINTYAHAPTSSTRVETAAGDTGAVPESRIEAASLDDNDIVLCPKVANASGRTSILVLSLSADDPVRFLWTAARKFSMSGYFPGELDIAKLGLRHGCKARLAVGCVSHQGGFKLLSKYDEYWPRTGEEKLTCLSVRYC